MCVCVCLFLFYFSCDFFFFFSRSTDNESKHYQVLSAFEYFTAHITYFYSWKQSKRDKFIKPDVWIIPQIIHLKLIEKNKYLNISQSFFFNSSPSKRNIFDVFISHWSPFYHRKCWKDTRWSNISLLNIGTDNLHRE